MTDLAQEPIALDLETILGIYRSAFMSGIGTVIGTLEPESPMEWRYSTIHQYMATLDADPALGEMWRNQIRDILAGTDTDHHLWVTDSKQQ